MKIHNIILPTFASLLLFSCSSDDDSAGKNTYSNISVPIEIYTGQDQVTSRATGDPGYNDELAAPKYVYVWAYAHMGSGSYDVAFKQITSSDNSTELASTDWYYSLGSGQKENQDSRYQLLREAKLEFNSNFPATDGVIGHVYAIACSKALTDAQINSVYSGLKADANKSSKVDGEYVVTVSSDPETTIEGALLNLSDWTSTDFRDLYSNPKGDTGKDANSLGNGEIKIVSSAPKYGTLRLYHAAAKMDFTWEIAASLRPDTYIKSITLNNLPTSCKIFEPTANTNASGTATITTDMSSQWTGRDYVYALQPASGVLNYTVLFSEQSRNTNNTHTFTPASLDNVFTGWYRVIATVSE